MYYAMLKPEGKIVLYLESKEEVDAFYKNNEFDKAFWLGKKVREMNTGKRKVADIWLIQGLVIEVLYDE